MLTRANRTKERKKRVRKASTMLLENLYLAHELTRSEIGIIKKIAKDLSYPDPALVFFLPDTFEKYLQRNKDIINKRQKKRIEHISYQLFAQESPGSVEAKSPVGDDGLPHRFASDELQLSVLRFASRPHL